MFRVPTAEHCKFEVFDKFGILIYIGKSKGLH